MSFMLKEKGIELRWYLLTKMTESIQFKINVDEDFYKMIQKYIQDFQKEHGIKISIPNATKMIYIKIQKKGGLTLEWHFKKEIR